MCLKATRSTPYNHSGTAYKLLARSAGRYTSPFQYTCWDKNQLKANCATKATRGQVNWGIHVFPHLRDALHCFKHNIGRKHSGFALVKLHVRGFIAAGKHIHYSQNGNGLLGECWTRAKITKVLHEKSASRGWY